MDRHKQTQTDTNFWDKSKLKKPGASFLKQIVHAELKLIT